MTYPKKVLCGMCRTRDHEDVEMELKYQFDGLPHPLEPDNGFRIYKCPECAHEHVIHGTQGPRRGKL